MNKLLALVVLLGVTGAVACDGARKARKKARLSHKVDCVKLCTRTFKKCPAEVVVAAGKMTTKRLESLKAAGAFERIQSLGYDACLRDCNKKKGRGSDVGRINTCLKKVGCKPFAECIKEVIQ